MIKVVTLTGKEKEISIDTHMIAMGIMWDLYLDAPINSRRAQVLDDIHTILSGVLYGSIARDEAPIVGVHARPDQVESDGVLSTMKDHYYCKGMPCIDLNIIALGCSLINNTWTTATPREKEEARNNLVIKYQRWNGVEGENGTMLYELETFLTNGAIHNFKITVEAS